MENSSHPATSDQHPRSRLSVYEKLDEKKVAWQEILHHLGDPTTLPAYVIEELRRKYPEYEMFFSDPLLANVIISSKLLAEIEITLENAYYEAQGKRANLRHSYSYCAENLKENDRLWGNPYVAEIVLLEIRAAGDQATIH